VGVLKKAMALEPNPKTIVSSASQNPVFGSIFSQIR
jgi:hypothetical protein